MKKIKNIKNILLATAVTASVALCVNTEVFAANTAKVKVETANLRTTTSSDSKILELISMGEEVEILEKSGDWYKVKYKSIEGYVRNDLIDVKEEVQEEQQSVENVAKTEEQNTESKQDDNKEDNKEENKLGDYKVKEDSSIKILPLIQSKGITDLKINDIVKVVDIKNNWGYVETEKSSGWVNLEKIEYVKEEVKQEEKAEETTKSEEAKTEEQNTTESTTENTAETTPQATNTTTTKYVGITAVNVRQKPSTSSEVLKSVTINTEVTVLEEANGWSKVEVNGIKGYISSQLLSDTKKSTSRGSDTIRRETEETTNTNTSTSTQSSSTSTSSKGEEVVAYAKQFLGCKYVYGGTSPSGFDCSGFAQYVYKHFGVSLNRTAAAQYSNGTSVTNLQAGDLVMFKNGSSTINHVGIYIGGGTFIHAANPSRGVTTDTLSSGYYKNNYVGARRIF